MTKKTTPAKEVVKSTTKTTSKPSVKKETIKAESSTNLATKSASKKAEEFNIKQVGQNLIIVKGDEKLSRKFENKEERDKVKELAAKYSFKPSAKLYKEIKSLMSVAKEERKDYLKKAADKAKGKKDEKPVEAKLVTTEEQIEAAKKLLQDNNYNVTAKTAAPTKRYRGEH